MSINGKSAETIAAAPPGKRRAPWPLIILTALFIIVPFLTWYGTWFGRSLSDEEVATYLADEKSPRHMQHALSQVADRIERRDPNVKRFFPQVIALSKNPIAEIRKTTAWVMGQDNSVADFHQALIALLADSEPMVRRNAALQLVRFGDGAGRPELRAMLQSFAAKSPIAGTVISILPQGSRIGAGALLARIRDASNAAQEFRSPVGGAIGQHVVKEGEAVAAGQTIVWLTPDRRTISDALQALAYVGTRDDLPLVETCAQVDGNMETSRQAETTANAIKRRTQSEK